MFDDGMRIELATRLRTMNRVLDRIVPDSSTEAVEAAIEIMLEAVARREVGEAVVALEDVVGANPFWLRGYLLLATISTSTSRTPTRPSQQQRKVLPHAPAASANAVP